MASHNKNDLTPEAQARVDFVRSIVPRRKPNISLRISFLLLAIVIIVGLIWLLASGPKPSNKPVNSAPKIPAATTLSATTPTTSYTSKYFGMSLTYPKTWTLKDNNKGVLELISPLTNLMSANRTTQKGQLTLNVMNQGQFPAGLTSGTDLAVLDSVIATYTNPSQNQSGQTYISFVQYSSTNTKGGLDGIYITGNFGYQKDQVISTTDLNKISPLVYVSFSGCSNKLCSTETALTIASSSWASTPLSQIITNIVQSFVFN